MNENDVTYNDCEVFVKITAASILPECHNTIIYTRLKPWTAGSIVNCTVCLRRCWKFSIFFFTITHRLTGILYFSSRREQTDSFGYNANLPKRNRQAMFYYHNRFCSGTNTMIFHRSLRCYRFHFLSVSFDEVTNGRWTKSMHIKTITIQSYRRAIPLISSFEFKYTRVLRK